MIQHTDITINISTNSPDNRFTWTVELIIEQWTNITINISMRSSARIDTTNNRLIAKQSNQDKIDW